MENRDTVSHRNKKPAKGPTFMLKTNKVTKTKKMYILKKNDTLVVDIIINITADKKKIKNKKL
jgi:hypothetical protein